MKKIIKNLILFGGIIGLTIPFFTWASYQDKEISENNSVVAASLDAKVTAGESELQLSTTASDMLAGDSLARTATIENVGGLEFKYEVAFKKASGEDILCSALQLDAKKNGTLVYSGNLNNFDYKLGDLNFGADEKWNFEINLPNNIDKSLENLDCNFKFIWTAWQTDFAKPNKGWVDEEEINGNEIHSGNWINLEDVVLNEFIPNPVGNDNNKINDSRCRNAGECGEWVELYNKGSQDINVDGWYLYDNYDNHSLKITNLNADNNNDLTDSGEVILPARGFLVVYRNGDGNFALNNSGFDSIRLFNGKITDGATLIDSYSYSGRDHNILLPTPNDNNSNIYSGRRGNNIPEGKSFVRYPDGANTWIDPVPTPGKKNDNDNTLKKFQNYYKSLCFDKKGSPICERDFMVKIGLLKNEKIKSRNEINSKKKADNLLEKLIKKTKKETSNKADISLEINNVKKESAEKKENKKTKKEVNKGEEKKKQLEKDNQQKQVVKDSQKKVSSDKEKNNKEKSDVKSKEKEGKLCKKLKIKTKSVDKNEKIDKEKTKSVGKNRTKPANNSEKPGSVEKKVEKKKTGKEVLERQAGKIKLEKKVKNIEKHRVIKENSENNKSI